MPTLILPPRYTDDANLLWRTAIATGWTVERLNNWRVPDYLVGHEISLYGEPLFAAAVADRLGIALLEPAWTWTADLPESFRKRRVEAMLLSRSRQKSFPAFVKPTSEKCFVARVYESAEELPDANTLEDSTRVLVAEPVSWAVEFRCFVLDRQVLTYTPYLRMGQLAEAADGSWPATESELGEALEFASQVIEDQTVLLPASFVLDVGIISGRGWAVVEANSAWGSGIYGCDPSEVLKVIQRSCVPVAKISDNDRPWIMQQGKVSD
jgi:hypothetical protein